MFFDNVCLQLGLQRCRSGKVQVHTGRFLLQFTVPEHSAA